MDYSPATVNKVNKLTKSETEHSTGLVKYVSEKCVPLHCQGFLKPTFTSTEHSLFKKKDRHSDALLYKPQSLYAAQLTICSS